MAERLRRKRAGSSGRPKRSRKGRARAKEGGGGPMAFAALMLMVIVGLAAIKSGDDEPDPFTSRPLSPLLPAEL